MKNISELQSYLNFKSKQINKDRDVIIEGLVGKDDEKTQACLVRYNFYNGQLNMIDEIRREFDLE